MNPALRFHRILFSILTIFVIFNRPALAVITVQDYWRMGGNDSGAGAGRHCTNAVDIAGGHILTNIPVAGIYPVYTNTVSTNAANTTGSTLALIYTNGEYGKGSVISGLVNNFGIEMWVKPNTTNSGILAYNGTTTSSGWGLAQSGMNFQATFGGVGTFGPAPAAINLWTHLALVRNNGTNTLYTNGVAASTNTSSPNSPAGSFLLAADNLGSETNSCVLDEVRVFTFAVNQFSTNDLLFYAAPVVSTLPATGISNAVATLNGTVIPNGLATTAWFQWGTSPYPYAQQTAAANVAAGRSTIAISNALSGLTPGLNYHCRLVASNALGTVHGADLAFGAPFITSTNLTNECHIAFMDPTIASGAPTAIAAGEDSELLLKNDGTLFAWGDNVYGQTNIPAGLSNNVAAFVSGGFDNMVLENSGTVLMWGENFVNQTNVPAGLSNVVAIAASGLYSMVLKNDGTILAWGDNTYSETNIPTGLSNVVAIAAGFSYGLALKNDTTVVTWGSNPYGVTNIPAGLSNVVAISSDSYHNLALESNGTVVAWGDNLYGETNLPAGLSNVVAIAAGGYHNLALKSDGTVAAWGAGSSNNPGDGYDFGQSITTGLSNVVAIAAGTYDSMAMKSDGTVLVWGNNTYGQTNVPAAVNKLNLNLVVSGSIDTNTPGIYALTYTSSTNTFGGIASVTRNVVVQDTTPPVITINGGNPLTNLLNVPFVDPGATALDACGGVFGVNTNSTVNVALAGFYTVTYSSTDGFGNTTNAVRTVVVDGPPIISSLTAVVLGTNSANGSRTVQFSAGVNPNELASSVNFQFGLSSTYAGTNGPVALPAASAVSNVTVAVAGFGAGFTYHWNVVAANSSGTTIAPDQTFTITPPGSGVAGDLNGDGIVSQSELNTVYSNYLSTSPWLYLTNVAGLGGTNVTFSLSNSISGGYSVQYSTDLVNWYYLGPATPRYLFTDTNAPALPLRYYRLSYP